MRRNAAKSVMRVMALGMGAAMLWMLLAPAARAQDVRIAAAADLQFAMKELAADYEQSTGQKVAVSYGSSGNFFAQLQNGAPYDLFFSADASYPRKLIDSGAAVEDTYRVYAIGSLVLWGASADHLNIAKKGWAALSSDAVRKIAIANPEHAPYGRAAVEALKKAGIYDQVKAKLVYGENISQAAQFVQSGSAQVGLLAMSLTRGGALKDGDVWPVPEDLHQPIEQGVVMMKSSAHPESARKFLEFTRSVAGKAILERYGFREPQASAAGHS